MSLVVFFVLALATAAAVVYPLARPGAGKDWGGVVQAGGASDAEIARTVGDFRRARGGTAQAAPSGGSTCPACGRGYRAGDRFCVQCGGSLPEVAPQGAVCASCGAPLRPDDRFCAKCGEIVATGVDA